MTVNGWLQIAIFFFLILLTARPLGRYMASVFEGRKTLLDPILLPVERLLYRLTGVHREEEMRWTEYGVAMLIFSLATALLGGFTPALCTYLIHSTGNRAMPGLWMSFAAVLGLIAALLIPRSENALADTGLSRQNA